MNSMNRDPESWRNRSPGNLDLLLDAVHRTDVAPVVEAAQKALRSWSRLPMAERIALLLKARQRLEPEREDLALGISIETGKPLQEARGELGAVISKFDLSIADADRFLSPEAVNDGPHPAWIRRRPRGVAAVIAPFNFPLHLGNGAILPHLLAGNPVIFKPSPLAAGVAARYAQILASALPPGVFGLVQGGAQTSLELCSHPNVRSICFTGSATAGRHLAQLLAGDLSKDLALELGGKNALIVCADADLALAATAVADGMCLTAGQRCNSTSRILVDERIITPFMELLTKAVAVYSPADPTEETTKLGPLIGKNAVERYRHSVGPADGGEWILPGSVMDEVGGLRGHFVKPALFHYQRRTEEEEAPMLHEELFAPIAVVQSYSTLDEAARHANATRFGLTCSIFTRSESQFWRLADEVEVGNIYANLPTTFSPSTLPFGGWGESGNGHPGGRGFIRFTTAEQAVQIAKQGFDPGNPGS